MARKAPVGNSSSASVKQKFYWNTTTRLIAGFLSGSLYIPSLICIFRGNYYWTFRFRYHQEDIIHLGA